MGAPKGNKNASGKHRRRSTFVGKGGKLLHSTTYKGQMKIISAYTRKMQRLYGRDRNSNS